MTECSVVVVARPPVLIKFGYQKSEKIIEHYGFVGSIEHCGGLTKCSTLMHVWWCWCSAMCGEPSKIVFMVRVMRIVS